MAAANAGAKSAGAAAGGATSTPRGAFIVLEGVDRCGKSTQCARLVERLTADGVSEWRGGVWGVRVQRRGEKREREREAFVFQR